jgi:hypothetical protein
MKSTQSDKGLGFDGAAEVARRDSSKKFAGNQSGLTGTVNAGRGPTKGNDGTCHDPISGSKSAKGAPVAALKGKPSNPDSFNAGPQVRNPGGTRAFDPQCCGNYKGNPDRQNVGRGPTKGNE